mgnify:CR=1 FL=1
MYHIGRRNKREFHTVPIGQLHGDRQSVNAFYNHADFFNTFIRLLTN